MCLCRLDLWKYSPQCFFETKERSFIQNYGYGCLFFFKVLCTHTHFFFFFRCFFLITQQNELSKMPPCQNQFPFQYMCSGHCISLRGGTLIFFIKKVLHLVEACFIKPEQLNNLFICQTEDFFFKLFLIIPNFFPGVIIS